MSVPRISQSILDCVPGDGTFAGARKLYLAQGLSMTLIQRLRAVESMAESAQFLRTAMTVAQRDLANDSTKHE